MSQDYNYLQNNSDYNNGLSNNDAYQAYQNNYDLDYENTDNSGSNSQNINLLEGGLIVFCIFLLIVSGLWGFFSQGAKIRDKQRIYEISQVLDALDNFYYNSNTFPTQRAYPIAQCSGRLNEVDFEFTLKQILGGQKPQLDNHPYIKNENFPKDNWGIYSQSPKERKTKLLDCPKLFSKIDNDSKSIYLDKTASCNFSQTQRKFRKCYLYTTSTNGDKYEVAYYSESQNAFVIYSRLRDGQVKLELQKI
jgi:hypothetical protein